jgi:tetratricopeptide (TPR) repeat protein
MDELWERVRAGKHTALVGLAPGEPPPGLGARLLWVRCDLPPTTLGPLHEARRTIDHLLGRKAPLFDQARDRMVSSLRRRLLGDVPALAAEAALVETYNRLAECSDRPAALVFEGIDAADEATLGMLRRILGRPGWLKLPLVLVFRSTHVEGGAAALLGAMRANFGEDSVIRARVRIEEPAPGEATTSPMAASEAAPAPAPSRTIDLRALPHEVLRVLRAGAAVGSGFEADIVAALLEVDVLYVLDLLQRAADAGVPIEDRGEMRFHVPEPILDALRASTLPSLMVAQHRRLAEILGDLEEDEAALPDEIASAPDTRRAEPESEEPEAPAITTSPKASEPSGDEDLGERPPPGAWPYADLFARAAAAAAEEPAPVGTSPKAASAPAAVSVPSVPKASAASAPAVSEPPALDLRASRPDDARAARHLAEAGDLQASAERYFAAAQKAAAAGAYAQALVLGDKALAALEDLPASPARRRLRARVLMTFGRLKWLASGPDEGFTLASALEQIEAARASLTKDDPPEIKAEAAQLIASVCYDVGDMPALTRALDELTAASRALLEARDVTGAARLLNDLAAVYVRLGDPVQATHLLSESRRIFEERAATDPVAAIEMAETDHLFARIPLHVPARPGREGDALTMGLDHAIAAERTYKKLDDRRELARVWETMGRLEIKKGRLERARARLTSAIQLQEQIGDVVGLARSTAAFSELLAVSGHPEEALSVLADSIALNLEKGSPIGLAFNRRGLAAIARTAGAASRATLTEVERRLAEAEGVLGRIHLAGERDA